MEHKKQGNKIDIIETRACHVIYHKIIDKCVNFMNVVKTLQQMYKWYQLLNYHEYLLKGFSYDFIEVLLNEYCYMNLFHLFHLTTISK